MLLNLEHGMYLRMYVFNPRYILLAKVVYDYLI